MSERGRMPSVSAICWVGMALSLLLVGGCREDGATSDCPEIPLYDVRSDAELDPNIVAARETAAAAGCLTLSGDASVIGDGGPGDPNDQ
jgi:hypothetical protein